MNVELAAQLPRSPRPSVFSACTPLPLSLVLRLFDYEKAQRWHGRRLILSALIGQQVNSSCLRTVVDCWMRDGNSAAPLHSYNFHWKGVCRDALADNILMSDALLKESRLCRPDREVLGCRQQPVGRHACPLLHSHIE